MAYGWQVYRNFDLQGPLWPRFGVAAVKILLPATGRAEYIAPWLSVAVTGREPTGKPRFKE